MMPAFTTWLRAAALGAATGGRSMTPIAVISWRAKSGLLPMGTKLSCLDKPLVARLLAVLAALELVADKLPMTPDRTKPASLAWRTVMGGTCGAIVASLDARSVPMGATTGAAGAVLASYGFLHARLWLDGLEIPDLLTAVLADVVIVSATLAVVRRSALGPSA